MISSAECLTTASYNQLMPSKTGHFQVVRVSPTTITIDQDGIRNTVSINRSTLAPSTKYAKRQILYGPDEQVHKWAIKSTKVENRVLQKSPDALPECPVSRIVCHVGESDSVQYTLCWYGYTVEDDTSEPSEHINEHFVSRYLRRRKRTGAVRQQCGRAHANRRRQIPR